jgi:hypothetical protein
LVRITFSARREDGVTDRVASFLAASVVDGGEGDHVVVDKVGDLAVEVDVESLVCESRVGDVQLLSEALKVTGLGLSNRGDRRGGSKKERSKLHLVFSVLVVLMSSGCCRYGVVSLRVSGTYTRSPP